MLEDWKLAILDREVQDMNELIAWLDSGKFTAEADDEAVRGRALQFETPGENIAAMCRISQMANTLFGTKGYARDTERRLRKEATPQQVRTAAIARRERAQAMIDKSTATAV